MKTLILLILIFSSTISFANCNRMRELPGLLNGLQEMSTYLIQSIENNSETVVTELCEDRDGLDLREIHTYLDRFYSNFHQSIRNDRRVSYLYTYNCHRECKKYRGCHRVCDTGRRIVNHHIHTQGRKLEEMLRYLKNLTYNVCRANRENRVSDELRYLRRVNSILESNEYNQARQTITRYVCHR